MKILRNIFLCFFSAFIAIILLMNIKNIFNTSFGSDSIAAVTYVVISLAAAILIIRLKDLSIIAGNIMLLAIIALGFILRFAYVWFIDTIPISDYKTMYDAAVGISRGDFSVFSLGMYFHRFPHLTIYTLVCGLLFKAFGINIFIIKLINVFFSSLCIYIVYLIGKSIRNQRLGLMMSIFYAFFPPSVAYCSVLVTENFAMPFLVLSLYFVILAYKSQTVKRSAVNMFFAGVILSVGCLFRNVTPFYICAYVIGSFTVFVKRTRLVPIAVFLCAFFIVFQFTSLSLYYSHITAYRLDDGGVPYSIFVLIGFNFETNGMYNEEDQNVYFEANGDKQQINKLVYDKLGDRIRTNYKSVIKLFREKTKNIYANRDFASVYWSYDNNGSISAKNYLSMFYRISELYFTLLLILTLFGAFFVKDKSVFCILGLIVLGFEAGYMMVEVQPRYTYSMAFVFVITAAYALYDLTEAGGMLDKKFVSEAWPS